MPALYRILLSFVLICCLATTSTGQDKKPNILFIFADDQSFETIHELGNSEIQTPTLDRLVREGTTFTHAFNMGSWSGAVCVASRMMLNSGRFVWRANKFHAKSKEEQKAGRWWSEYMKGAGYKTYFTGKWHCKADANASFDVAKNIRPGMPAQTPEGYNRPLADGTDTWSPSDPKFGGFWQGGKHWSEIVGDDAIGFIDDAKAQDKPFFMYVAFNAPHDPRQSPQEYVDRYPLVKISTPKNFLPLYPHKDKIRLGPSLRDEKLATFPRTEHGVKVNRQEYYAIISHMDDQIARVLEHLKTSGLAENTWIIFTADHGLACGHHGLMGKQNMYDHSLRVPFMVVGPGVEPGKKVAEPIYLQDAMATSLELAGVDKPEHVEFNSVLPLMKGGKSPYESIYGAYLAVQRCVRTDDYKLIVYPEAEVVRLFNLKEDPDEMVDLAELPESKPIIKQLFGKLLQHQEFQEDKLDLKSVFPELATK